MAPDADVKALASELMIAWASGAPMPETLSSRHAPFDLATAYAVEAELVRLRQAAGGTVVGLKVGYANKAVWRALKLETLVWAHMYTDTVHYSMDNRASLSMARMIAPKIEPEIVFKLKEPFEGGSDPLQILSHVEWLALGFEIIDCPFPGWQLQPADFVAVFGLHKALIVGQPQLIQPEKIPALAEQLPKFKLRLFNKGEPVEEGSGKNSLRSPALCLGELERVATLNAGDLVSSGTLTTGAVIAPGDKFRAEVEGIDLPGLTLEALSP